MNETDSETHLDVKEGNMTPGAGVSSAAFDLASFLIPARSTFSTLRHSVNGGGVLFNATAERYLEHQAVKQDKKRGAK